MKNKIAVLILIALAVTARAQTFTRYTLTNLNDITASSICFSIPTNTIFKGSVLPAWSGGDGASIIVTAQYPESTNQVFVGASEDSAHYDNPPFHTQPVLGPATIYFTGYGEANDISVLIAEFDAVNTTPEIQGFGVQPANSTAQIALETSTDLKMWQSATNGTYGLTNAARFFRMNLSVSP